jgi:hypothetical protein
MRSPGYDRGPRRCWRGQPLARLGGHQAVCREHGRRPRSEYVGAREAVRPRAAGPIWLQPAGRLMRMTSVDAIGPGRSVSRSLTASTGNARRSVSELTLHTQRASAKPRAERRTARRAGVDGHSSRLWRSDRVVVQATTTHSPKRPRLGQVLLVEPLLVLLTPLRLVGLRFRELLLCSSSCFRVFGWGMLAGDRPATCRHEADDDQGYGD